MMRALVFPKYGEAMQINATIPIPEPRDDEVLVKVRAASLNPIDKMRQNGLLKAVFPETQWPAVIGYDLAGTVVKSNLAEYSAGDEVVARIQRMRPGAVAEYCCVPKLSLVRKPEELNFAEAAAAPLAGMTAYQVLREAALPREGARVFVSSGAGGVGTFFLQIAKKVFNVSYAATTASPGRGEELVREMGADEVVNYRVNPRFEEQLAKKSFDLALDCINEPLEHMEVVKPGGRVVSLSGKFTFEETDRAVRNGIDNTEGKGLGLFIKWIFKLFMEPKDVLRAAKEKGVHWRGQFLNPTGKELEEFFDVCVRRGGVRPVIDETYRLEEAMTAWDKFASGRSKGKIVIVMEGENDA